MHMNVNTVNATCKMMFFILSVVLWTPWKLQLMAGAEWLCHIFEEGRELMSCFRMGSWDEKGWEPLLSVVLILPPRCWQQQIGWSYCAASRKFGFVAWCNTKKKVIFSGRRCPARGVMVRCYGCYASGWRFDSRLANFLLFFSLLFSRLRLDATFTGYCCLVRIRVR